MFLLIYLLQNEFRIILLRILLDIFKNFFLLIELGFLLMILANFWVFSLTEGRTYTKISKIPPREVALVWELLQNDGRKCQSLFYF